MTFQFPPHISFSDVDGLGRRFSNFFVSKDPVKGPGWFILGRNEEYGGRLVRNCGFPHRKPRKHVHYNGKVQMGWRTKKEALAALEEVQKALLKPPE